MSILSSLLPLGKCGRSCMRVFVISAFLVVGSANISPLRAQVSANDLFGLGVQILNNANRKAAKQSKQRQEAQQTQREETVNRAAVREVQRRLKQLGYLTGKADGRIGAQTRRAIARFQGDHGLPQTGQIDRTLIAALEGTEDGSENDDADGSVSSAEGEKSAAFVVHKGFDIPAGDYRSGLQDPKLKNISQQACQRMCASEQRCKAFTYNLSAEVCFLKASATKRTRFAGAVSGIKDAGMQSDAPSNGDTAESGAVPGPATFVNMALMSDTDAYLAAAALTGVNYIMATGTEQECRELYDVQQRDEFARRDFLKRAASLARKVIEGLPSQSRQVEFTIESSYSLAEYDFDRQGFPFRSSQYAKLPILASGAIGLVGKRPTFCNTGWAYPGDFQDEQLALNNVFSFANLSVAHDGVPGVDFLPMHEDAARQFRASGNNVILRAELRVEPRDQGRGPLKGRILSLAAYDPNSGRLLHRWSLQERQPTTAQQESVPWTGQLLAALVSPIVDSNLDRTRFDYSAADYFKRYVDTISKGNPPPESPLPIEDMRGRQAEVIVARNRDRLRAFLRDNTTQLPVSVAMEQRWNVDFNEQSGLTFGRIENDPGSADAKASLAELKLSSRDLPLYDQLSFLRPWGERGEIGFREWIVSDQPVSLVLELDKLVRLQPVAMTIEEAAARGLVGHGGKRDSAIVRWEIDIAEVRTEKDKIVVSASVRTLSARWTSDNAVITEFAVDTFPTVLSLRQAADDSLPPQATSDNLMTPPPGTRFGAEMADLLQLRFQPASVDDLAMEWMMLTRFGYEASLEGRDLAWGSFFPKLEYNSSVSERTKRLKAFRTWSEARAGALPEYLTITLPLYDTREGKFAPFERLGAHKYAEVCTQAASESSNPPSVADIERGKICQLLDAAWRSTEPLLYFDAYDDSKHYQYGLRDDCDNDRYCTAIQGTRAATNSRFDGLDDYVLVDRLPVLDSTVRNMMGNLALELDVKPNGATIEKSQPQTRWITALGKAYAHANTHGVGIVDDPPFIYGSNAPMVLFNVSTISARVVDRDTGTVVAELNLAEPGALPLGEFEASKSEMGELDILGVRLGMTFGEAEKRVREQINVGAIYATARQRQMRTSGVVVSSDSYATATLLHDSQAQVMIALYTEPPAGGEGVTAITRSQLFATGQGPEPKALLDLLIKKYGEPVTGTLERGPLQWGPNEGACRLAFGGLTVTMNLAKMERDSGRRISSWGPQWFDGAGVEWAQPMQTPDLAAIYADIPDCAAERMLVWMLTNGDGTVAEFHIALSSASEVMRLRVENESAGGTSDTQEGSNVDVKL